MWTRVVLTAALLTLGACGGRDSGGGKPDGSGDMVAAGDSFHFTFVRHTYDVAANLSRIEATGDYRAGGAPQKAVLVLEWAGDTPIQASTASGDPSLAVSLRLVPTYWADASTGGVVAVDVGGRNFALVAGDATSVTLSGMVDDRDGFSVPFEGVLTARRR